MIDLKFIEKYLLKAGFVKDPKDYGRGGTHGHYYFKYYKRCGEVWVMKTYDDDEIYIGCLIRDEKAEKPVMTVACNYDGGRWIVINMDLRLLLVKICRNEQEPWIKVCSKYSAEETLKVLDD